jgi:hypothetical protein
MAEVLRAQFSPSKSSYGGRTGALTLAENPHVFALLCSAGTLELSQHHHQLCSITAECSYYGLIHILLRRLGSWKIESIIELPFFECHFDDKKNQLDL